MDDWEIDIRVKNLSGIQGALSLIQPIANQAKSINSEKLARIKYQDACYKLMIFLDWVNEITCPSIGTSLDTLNVDIRRAKEKIKNHSIRDMPMSEASYKKAWECEPFEEINNE